MPAGAPSRLAAVWFADIVGYSGLASRDEAAAVRLVEVLRSLVGELLDEHGGRLVKGTGDGALAEFTSADAAVRTECLSAARTNPSCRAGPSKNWAAR